MTSSVSQEVVWCSSVDVAKVILLWSGVELQEGVFHELVHLHNGCFVTTSVTIVWCREHSDYVTVMRPVVAVHHKLMCSGDQLQIVRVVELFRDILTKGVAGTSW